MSEVSYIESKQFHESPEVSLMPWLILLQCLWNLEFCLYVIPLHPYIPKIKNSDGASTLISDILSQMLVPPFSLEILRKLSYFVFFTTKSL